MEDTKIPTAKEYLGWAIIGNIENPVEELKLIGFAKLHVKEALKAASENAMLKVVNTEEFRDIEEGEDLVDSYECGSDVIHISVNSILNAYPDSNIV